MNAKKWTLALVATGLGAGLGWWAVGEWALPRPAREPVRGPHPSLPAPARDAPAHDARLGAPPRFVDARAECGIAFRHENGLTGKFHYPEIMGGGVGLFDYDGDGFLDIYLVNGNRLLGEKDPSLTNRLWRNNGDGTFTDVTARSGTGDPGYGQGCCAADCDGDGDVDLFVSNFGPDRLYRNEGDGTFREIAAEAGVADPGWGQTCSFLDYDDDGRLDLYIQNYLTYRLDLQFQAYIWVGDRKVVDYPSPKEFPGAADRLLRNEGASRFRDVTAECGLATATGKGMGCACADLDDDGHVDIFIANDSMENFLYFGNGDGTFTESGLLAGVSVDGLGTPEASMGVDLGDYDGDGRLDIITPCIWEQVFTLYRGEGRHFQDVSWSAGLGPVTSERTGFSPAFLDYDNDGDIDLFFSNGGVRVVTLGSPGATYQERYGQPDLLLANDGAGRFHDVSAAAGPHFARPTIGRGAATGDIDNDGDIDLVISNLAGEPSVLRNETEGGHWVTLLLAPRRGSRDALGTTVRLEAGGRRQRVTVHGGVTYLSQCDRRPHFGLGDADRIDRIEVRWPGGAVQSWKNLPADRFLTLSEGEPEPR